MKMYILIINGTLCTKKLWQDFEDEVCRVFAKEVHIRYADIEEAKSIQEYADEIGAYIQSFAEGKVFVLGYSLGGIICIELAKRHQEYIDAMILVCSNHQGQTEKKEIARMKQLEVLEEEGLEVLFKTILLPAYFGERLDSYNTEANIILEMGMSLGERVLKNQLEILNTRIDQTQFLKYIDIPVLQVYGELDTLCTAGQNKEMGQLFPRSELCEIHDTGHMIPLLKSEEMSGRIITFMEDVMEHMA